MMSEAVWVRALQTSVLSLAYDFRSRTGTLYMPPDCCTDMSGAIALFKRIDPRVLRVVTMAGEREDTKYERSSMKTHWVAVRER